MGFLYNETPHSTHILCRILIFTPFWFLPHGPILYPHDSTQCFHFWPPIPHQILFEHATPHFGWDAGAVVRYMVETRTNTNDADKWLTLIALSCSQQSRAPNIECCMPEIWLWPWPWPLTFTPTLDIDFKQGKSHVKRRFLAFDLDQRPTTLTYIANLAKAKVDLHAKDEGRRSNG